MPTHRYDIVKNNKIVYTTFSMLRAKNYCALHNNNVVLQQIKL